MQPGDPHPPGIPWYALATALLLAGLFFCGDLLGAVPAVPGGALPAGAVVSAGGSVQFQVDTAGVRAIYTTDPDGYYVGYGDRDAVEDTYGKPVDTAQNAVAVRVEDGSTALYSATSFSVKPGIRYTVTCGDECWVAEPPHLLGLSGNASRHLVGNWLLVLGLLPGLALFGLIWRRTRSARAAAAALAAQ